MKARAFAWVAGFVIFFSLTASLQGARADAASSAAGSCDKPVLFFDLGDVLIDTHDWDNLRYMSGALGYLEKLKTDGYSLGLIVNIPAEWGTTNEERIATLKSFVAKTWKEPAPFAWELFNLILVPYTNAERKPAPAMFLRALKSAGSCPALYQGEKDVEIAEALKLGLKAHDVGTGNQFKLLPEEEICQVADTPCPVQRQL
jgi:FMN phosphatase YigB (HAD superfamily)